MLNHQACAVHQDHHSRNTDFAFAEQAPLTAKWEKKGEQVVLAGKLVHVREGERNLE
jgi:hypothetical protein